MPQRDIPLSDRMILMILRATRKRRMFHLATPALHQHCEALKHDGLLAGSAPDGYRLTKKGHQYLKSDIPHD